MQDIGTLGGHNSGGSAINLQGQVVGSAQPNDVRGYYHAFLYSNGTMQDLGTLAGADPEGNTESVGTAVNSKGQVTGYSFLTGGAGPQHAFLFSNGKMQDLGTLGGTGGDDLSRGEGIDNAGEVAGWSFDANFHERAFLYKNGVMHDLGTLGGNLSVASGIASTGQVLGASTVAGEYAWHAFVYSGGTMTDLNSLISPPVYVSLSEAIALNKKGLILRMAMMHQGEFMLIYLRQSNAKESRGVRRGARCSATYPVAVLQSVATILG